MHLIPRRREGTVLYVCLLFQYNTKCSQGSTILKKSKIQSEEVTQNPNPRVYVISFTCAISYSDLIVHQAPAQRQPKISYLQIIEYLTLHASQPSPTHEKKPGANKLFMRCHHISTLLQPTTQHNAQPKTRHLINDIRKGKKRTRISKASLQSAEIIPITIFKPASRHLLQHTTLIKSRDSYA